MRPDVEELPDRTFPCALEGVIAKSQNRPLSSGDPMTPANLSERIEVKGSNA
jgi:hypothetical protein